MQGYVEVASQEAKVDEVERRDLDGDMDGFIEEDQSHKQSGNRQPPQQGCWCRVYKRGTNEEGLQSRAVMEGEQGLLVAATQEEESGGGGCQARGDGNGSLYIQKEANNGLSGVKGSTVLYKRRRRG